MCPDDGIIFTGAQRPIPSFPAGYRLGPCSHADLLFGGGVGAVRQ